MTNVPVKSSKQFDDLQAKETFCTAYIRFPLCTIEVQLNCLHQQSCLVCGKLAIIVWSQTPAVPTEAFSLGLFRPSM
jgi:hypothetical protein